jgi:NitT/TauT family transport system substrate-binding protein
MLQPCRRLVFAVMLLPGLLLWGGSAACAEDRPVWQNGTVSPNGDAGMIYMAALGGFGPAFGLDLQMVALKGDPMLLKALIAGQIESYIGGPGSPLVAASRGAAIKIVGCNWNKQSYTFWARADIHSLADLRGKALGISTPGSAPDIFMRAALENAGVAPTSVQFVPTGTPSDMLSASAAGVIDATATPDEYAVRAQSMGLHALTTSDEATPLSMQRCYYVASDMVHDHPDRVARFLAAEIAAYSYSLSHRDATIALTRSIIHARPDAPEPLAGYDNAVARAVIDMSFQPPMEKLRWLRDVLTKGGQMKPGYDPAEMIDLGPLAQARALVQATGDAPASGAAAALTRGGN